MRAVTPFLLFAAVFLSSSLQGAQKWITAEYENLTFISDAGARKTQRIFEDIQTYKTGLRIAFEGNFKELKWPMKIVVCKGRKTMDTLGPERERGDKRYSGYYQRGPGYDLIVLNSATDSTNLRRIIFHEFTHRMFEGFGHLPLWLDEGYASVFEQFSVKKGKVKFGLGSQYYIDYLAYEEILPLERLFAVNHSSAEYNEESKVGSFYATSWAFVHMCMFSRDAQYADSFFKFTERLKGQPASEELFTECFGLTYKEMEKRIRSYTDGGKYLYRIVDVTDSIEAPDLEFEDLSTFDQNLHLASVLSHSKRFKEGRAKLIQCQYDIPTLTDGSGEEVKLQHARMASGFATLEFLAGNHEVTHDYAETAFTLGSKDVSTQLLYAESIIGIKPGYQSVRQLDMEDLTTVLDILMEVLSFNMKNLRAHRDHSYAWRFTRIGPRDSHIRALVNACRLYPDDKIIHFNVADLFLRLDRDQDAIGILEHYAGNTSDRSGYDQALKKLEAIEAGS